MLLGRTGDGLHPKGMCLKVLLADRETAYEHEEETQNEYVLICYTCTRILLKGRTKEAQVGSQNRSRCSVSWCTKCW